MVREMIGNPIHVRVGDLLPLIDDFRRDHGYGNRPDAVRELVRRGLAASAGERVLSSTWDLALYDATGAERNQYYEAIAQGRILRRTETPGSDPDWIQLVQYSDPLDNTDRFVIDVQQPDGGEWTDYTDREPAEHRYEQLVRQQADVGYLYQATDVAGVRLRPSADE